MRSPARHQSARPLICCAVASVLCVSTMHAQQRLLDEAGLAAARRVLLATDSAHGLAASTANGFAIYLADDAIYLEPGPDRIRGKDEIRALLARERGRGQLRFHPAFGDVSADGGVGYTVGWTMLRTATGFRYGKYLAFWRRQSGGQWKVEAWNRSGDQDAPARAPALEPWSPRSASAPKPVDARMLLSIDSAFAAASVANGSADAFRSYAAPAAVSLGGGRDFVVGRDAIRADQLAHAVPGELLDWTPVTGGLGAFGDLGWTVGDFRYSAPRDGKTVSIRGKYLTVWRKLPEGWRFVADGGSSTRTPAR